MNSIEKKLRRYISISVSTLLVAILLATDISVDSWISKEFDRAMISKAGVLETLIDEDAEEVDFDFAGEFMPEFEGLEDPEYFQLWYNDKVFERSDTLEFFDIQDLPRLEVELNSFLLQDITLPDGRSGRMLFSKFLPQVDSDVREELGITREQFALGQKPIEFAYALSTENLNYILWSVDIIFISASIVAVFIVRRIVSFVVKRNLKPIELFNQELAQISLRSDKPEVTTDGLPIELMPIAQGVNKFIHENLILYKREQRVTSDIAHELKTPITELLSLSEVALKFPHETRIHETLATDVNAITIRLKEIVNSILLLQKSSSNQVLSKKYLDLHSLIEEAIQRENTTQRRINLTVANEATKIVSNKFALETIVSNLVNNALFYSPVNSDIYINVSLNDDSHIEFRITNSCLSECNQDELNSFFEPLWQKDESRTSTERFGLGLAIVKSFCERLEASVSISLDEEGKITFCVVHP